MIRHHQFGIPELPLTASGVLRIRSWEILATFRGGPLGGCCVCQQGCLTWWDLGVCGMEPVADRDGSLTDRIPLHRRCVMGVITNWCTLLYGDPGEDDPHSSPAFAGDAPPLNHDRGPRRSPLGAYARRSRDNAPTT